MNTNTFITQRRSPLMQAMSLKKDGKKTSHGKELGLALPLTSLIDAFCIIVIYLLIGTQTTGVESKIPGQMSLPTAEHSQALEKEIATLKIEKGNYFLNEKPVPRTSLGTKLAELKKSTKEAMELLVQADTNMEYADLDPLLRAGSEAGIEKLRFAVIPTK
ncbi:MAG: biopolymer transporter ExbD [Bdellovibrionales bacterium]|nr:biopolymer transporter ExbD [Bdellovibrionales bacterium]